jgi:5-formyltetrahydrofolate cyclo-ligase
MIEKKLLRTEAKNIRKNLDITAISKNVVNVIEKWAVYNNSRNVMIYYPINSEISLLDLMNSEKNNDKLFYFPTINENVLFPVLCETEKNFKTGKYSIPEPTGAVLDDYSMLDIVFIPALCADKFGYRLGYGKGYYDRFLAQLPDNVIKVVVTADELLIDNLPIEKHDRQSDFVITQTGIYCKKNTSV